MKKDEDVFDVIAERIVSSHSVRKNAQSALSKHIARELRQTDHNAREELRRSLRTLLDVPSTEDLVEDHGY